MATSLRTHASLHDSFPRYSRSLCVSVKASNSSCKTIPPLAQNAIPSAPFKRRGKRGGEGLRHTQRADGRCGAKRDASSRTRPAGTGRERGGSRAPSDPRPRRASLRGSQIYCGQFSITSTAGRRPRRSWASRGMLSLPPPFLFATTDPDADAAASPIRARAV